MTTASTVTNVPRREAHISARETPAGGCAALARLDLTVPHAAKSAFLSARSSGPPMAEPPGAEAAVPRQGDAAALQVSREGNYPWRQEPARSSGEKHRTFPSSKPLSCAEGRRLGRIDRHFTLEEMHVAAPKTLRGDGTLAEAGRLTVRSTTPKSRPAPAMRVSKIVRRLEVAAISPYRSTVSECTGAKARNTMLSDRDLSTVHDLSELERLALPNMQPLARTIAMDGETIPNKEGWDRWALCPRILRGTTSCKTTTTVLDERISSPIMIAPHALQGLCHADAEVATAGGCAKADTIMVLPLAGTRTPEEVGAASRFWLMTVFLKDHGLMKDHMHRAKAAGASAVCVTVDYHGESHLPAAVRDAIGRLAPDLNFQFGYCEEHERSRWEDIDWGATWSDLEWLRQVSPLPIVLKGVMTTGDARQAAKLGVDGIIVSNHGGRSVREALPTADVLPEISSAVEGQVEVFVDGGVRSGADVLRAIALGARAVMVALPNLWGLTVGGAEGVARMLSILQGELEIAMAMVGAHELAEIDAESIALRNAAVRSHSPR